MYKLWNKLFGWDYVYWKNSADQGIARVHISSDDTVFYWRYGNIKLLDTLYPISDPYTQIVWLTCKQEKYYTRQNTD